MGACTLGTDPADDPLVYEEEDETFGTWVFRTKSRRFVMIACWQTLSNEFRYVDASRPADELLQVRSHRHASPNLQLDAVFGHGA